VLEDIQKLRDSLSDDQRMIVDHKVGKAIAVLLDTALSSETEEEAAARVAALTRYLRKSPLAAFKMYRALDKDQKAIVMKLMEAGE
jgi:hypothetical protein